MLAFFGHSIKKSHKKLPDILVLMALGVIDVRNAEGYRELIPVMHIFNLRITNLRQTRLQPVFLP